MHPGRGRRVAPIAAALLGLAVRFAAPGDGVPPGDTAGPDGLAARAKEIQNTCFALYPRELLARMATDDGTPVAEVRSDPARPQKYLKTEDVVEKGLFYPALPLNGCGALGVNTIPGTEHSPST